MSPSLTFNKGVLTLKAYKVHELAELEWVSVRTVQRNRDKYALIEIPFGKKGRVLKRYLDPEITSAILARNDIRQA